MLRIKRNCKKYKGKIMKVAFLKSFNGNFYDAWIGIFTWSTVAHCELIFSDNRWLSCRPGTGVIYRKRFDEVDHDPKDWILIDLPFDEDQERIIREWCENELGCKYDWKGIYSFILPFIREDPMRWFCSEICTAAIQIYMDLKLVPYKTPPRTLYNKFKKSCQSSNLLNKN
jgi:hypothetical protein